MDYLDREYETDIDLDFITNYHNNYENNKFFYTETIDTVNIFAIYVNKANEVIEIKRDKISLTNNILEKERLITLIKSKNNIDDSHFKINHIMKYNITIEQKNIAKFILHNPDLDRDNYLTPIKTLDDIHYNDSIHIFKDLTALYLIYKIKDQSVNSIKDCNHDRNQDTRKVFINEIKSKNRKTKRDRKKFYII